MGPLPGAVACTLALALASLPLPGGAALGGAGGGLTFSVGTIQCTNGTTTLNVSQVSVSALYLNGSGSESTGNYTWTEGTNYTEPIGLSGNVSVLLEASAPAQCPWAGTVWLDFPVADSTLPLNVSLDFTPGLNASRNVTGTTGNTTVTVPPPSPVFPQFLELVGLGTFCVFLYWGLATWRKAASSVGWGELP